MNCATFLNVCCCAIFYLIKNVISKDYSSDVLSAIKATEYDIRQVKYLQDNFYDFSNVDTQFLYSHVKRRSPNSDPNLFMDGCDCGDGGLGDCMRGVHPDGDLCRCITNGVISIVINGKCTDCVCPNGICNAATGHCSCLKGFGMQNGTCAACDCGEKKQFCHFEEGLQFCSCNDEYISVNEKCEDCVCGKEEICLKRPIGVCSCPKGSGIWTDECDSKCDCASITSNGCLFIGPQKICTCVPRKAKLDGTCIDCDCGENGECEFVDGKKKCSCKAGYELHNGTCEECFCGDGHSCTYKNGSSVCLCAENHYEQNGTCKECSCGPNERCEIIDGRKVCLCKEHFLKVNNSCTKCWCGEGHACDFVDEKKLCLCREGFADNNGLCEKCDCGANHWSCEFQKNTKICECPEGYADNNGICQECFCGKDSTCYFEDGEKLCICPDAQVQRNGSCSDVCLDDTCDKGTCEVSANGFYCNCKEGYSGIRCDQDEFLSEGAIYLILFLSIVTLFWVILLVVFIIRKRNRYRYFRNEKLDATMNMLHENHPDSTM